MLMEVVITLLFYPINLARLIEALLRREVVILPATCMETSIRVEIVYFTQS